MTRQTTSTFGFPNAATPPGSAAYYAVRFAAPGVRDDLAVLFAWYAEMQKLRTIREAGVARLKLRWWLDEIDRTARGQATHPLADALRGMVTRKVPGAAPFAAIASAIDAHLLTTAYTTHPQIAEHHRATGGTLACLIAALTAKDAPPGIAVREAGTFLAAVNTLGRLGAELDVPVPLVPHPVLTRHAASAVPSGDPQALVEELCDEAAALRPSVNDPLPPVLAGLTGIANARLAEIRRSGKLVLQAEVDLTPLHKLWTAWRRR